MIKHYGADPKVKHLKLVPEGTLRGHYDSITAICYVYIPSNLSYSDPASPQTYQILVPTLLTGDNAGWLIWWDLSTKRPMAVWKGHSSNIITIKQLGLQWKRNNGSDVPVIDEKFYGKVLTHGRDTAARSWDLFELLNTELLTYKFSQKFSHSLPTTPEKKDFLAPKFLEIPVNTLNYCNVDVYNDRLVTPSTTNSNNFDVYKLPTAGRPLERIFKDVNLYDIINPLESSDRNFGIIMKLAFFDEDRLCVGYESGDVILVSLAGFEVEILRTDSTAHRPNPILAISYDPFSDSAVITSANDKVLIMSESATTVATIKHHGICSASSRNDGLIGLTTWDGFTRIYDANFELKYKINKLTPSVKVNDLNIEDKDKVNVKIKPLVLEFSRIQENYNSLKAAKLVNYNNGNTKMIVRKREEAKYDRNWMCIGFNDGRIIFYDL